MKPLPYFAGVVTAEYLIDDLCSPKARFAGAGPASVSSRSCSCGLLYNVRVDRRLVVLDVMLKKAIYYLYIAYDANFASCASIFDQVDQKVLTSLNPQLSSQLIVLPDCAESYLIVCLMECCICIRAGSCDPCELSFKNR